MIKLDTNLFIENTEKNPKKLVLNGRSISEVVCGTSEKLTYLDLTENSISDVSGIASAFPNLTTLKLNKNHISEAHIGKLESLKHLVLLDLSGNKELTYLPRKPFSKLNDLQAFIASDCSISKVKNSLNLCKKLNTIILSRNNLTEFPENILIETSETLSKLNLSNNELSAFPNFSNSSKLVEINLNNNKISEIDKSISGAIDLRILNLCHNQITSFSELEKLKKNRLLIQLNLRGNPICEDEGYLDKIKELFPNLQILDTKRIKEKVKIGKRSAQEQEHIRNRAREFEEFAKQAPISKKRREEEEVQEEQETPQKETEKPQIVNNEDELEQKVKIIVSKKSKKQSINWNDLEESEGSW